MKMKARIFLLSLILASSLVACKSGAPQTAATPKAPSQAEILIMQTRKDFAPDARVALFQVEPLQMEEQLILKGESNLPDAVAYLKQKLEEQNISFTDSIQLLPSEDLEGKTEGVIKISVANLRSRPSHSSELVTQATMGMPVKVYKKEGDWYYIQTPDDYLAWVDYGGITSYTRQELSTWRSAHKVIYLEPFGFSYEEANTDTQVVSDVVAGSVLELLRELNGFYEIKYPDGKTAFIEKSAALPYDQWVATLNPSGESLIATSKSLKGLPYLWGGTSTKGVDCSGYTKTIFFLNGIILPRDASQQIHTGIEVDSSRNFENLQAGDLLFFGREATETSPERVIHVGMWIGDNKFIHSMGDVHISNFDTSAADFDEYNYNRYLRTKRILGQDDEKLIQLAQSKLYMN